MSTSKSRFTVAKLDAGMAILLTSDHHLIEFPSLLLPSGVAAGSIIDLSVAQNTTKEKEEHDKFIALQNDIRDLFAVHPPSTPELTVRNMTQTSVVLEWNLLDLSTAEMKSLSLYKNGSKLGKIPNATTTTTKLSGLALDTDYTFQLVLRTTAGVFKSKELKVRTHKMTNLTGLNVCLSNVKPEEKESITAILARIGAKPPHEKVRIDTTHFVTNRGMGEEFKKAQTMNIPIVVPEFVEACEAEGRLMRVGSYYLDSDPALRSKRAPPAAISQPRASTNGQNDANSETPAAAPAATLAETPADVDAILPRQTTPLTQESEESATTTTAASTITASIANAAEEVKERAQAGLEQVKSALGATPTEPAPENQEEEEVSLASAAEVAPATAKEESVRSKTNDDDEDDDATTKADIEPHQEPTRSVVDLPSQHATTPLTETPVDSGNTETAEPSTTEEMEDVAL